jgi:hypothetical protein
MQLICVLCDLYNLTSGSKKILLFWVVMQRRLACSNTPTFRRNILSPSSGLKMETVGASPRNVGMYLQVCRASQPRTTVRYLCTVYKKECVIEIKYAILHSHSVLRFFNCVTYIRYIYSTAATQNSFFPETYSKVKHDYPIIYMLHFTAHSTAFSE